MPNNTIADNLQRLVDAKNDIADAIVAKGGTVNEGDGLEEFPAAIDGIPTGSSDPYAKIVVHTEPDSSVTMTKVPIQLSVKADIGSTVTITNGAITYTRAATGDYDNFQIPFGGDWIIQSDVNGSNKSIREITITELTLQIDLTHRVYGAFWTVGPDPKFTRTDSAKYFDDPTPYMSGLETYGSPFDNVYPWSDIEIVTLSDDVFVKIPKFYYRLIKTKTIMKFQISDYQHDSTWHVDPMHMNRSDGNGERTNAYISRYLINSNGKSMSGQTPYGSGATWVFNVIKSPHIPFDYQALVTVWFLYLVEFANWNCVSLIGGPAGSAYNTGRTDSMPYHTGTMDSTRETTGVGVQYRYIEDLWNTNQHIDGMFSIKGYPYKLVTVPYKGGPNKDICIPKYTSAQQKYIVDWYVPSDDLYSWAMCPLTDSTGNIVASVTNYSCGEIGSVFYTTSSYYVGYLSGNNALFGINAISYDTSATNLYGRKIYLN